MSLSTHAIPEPQTAELWTLSVIAIGLYALSYVLRPKPKKAGKVDTERTTLTTRGSWLQLLIGRRLLAPAFGWAGDRTTREQGASGGKGKGGGGGQTVYYESAWHLLCVGPATRLHAIYKRGELLWSGPVDRASTPSGSAVETSMGTFYIYWGDATQPVNTFLADPSRVGVASRWPGCCYVLWVEALLGGAPQWDQIEYDVSCEAVGSQLLDSAPFLEATTAGGTDEGVNGAHAVYQLWTGAGPYGAGLEPETLDFGTLEALGEILEDEHLCTNLVVRDGRTAGDVLTDLADDLGFQLPQVGEMVAVIPMRPEASPPYFPDAALEVPNPEIDTAQGEAPGDVTNFAFDDRALRFKPNDVAVGNDAQSRGSGRRRVQEISLRTITDQASAQIAADRRAPLGQAGTDAVKLIMGYSARVLQPGMAFEVEGVGRLRLTSRRVTTDSGTGTFTAVPETFVPEATGWDPGPQATVGSREAPAADAMVALLELPRSAVGGALRVGVLRVRGNTAATYAQVYVSGDGLSYTLALRQEGWCRGGTLSEPLAADDSPLLDEGPTLVAYNDDIAQAQDLTGNNGAWLGGEQLAVLLSDPPEVCFVRRVLAVDGGYRLDGLARARGGTLPQDHAAGTPVLIAPRTSIRAVGAAGWGVGGEAHVKTQPAGVSLADAADAAITLRGVALDPGPVWNLAAHRAGPEAFTVSAVGDGYIELDGLHAARFWPGARVVVDGSSGADGLYHVWYAELSGSDTRLWLREDVPASSGGTLAVAAGGDHYEPGEPLWVCWDYAPLEGGGPMVGGAAPAGAAQPVDAAGAPLKPSSSGAFDVTIQDEAGSVVRRATVEGDYPQLAYDAATRLADFGTATPVIVVLVAHRVNGSGAWTRRSVFYPNP